MEPRDLLEGKFQGGIDFSTFPLSFSLPSGYKFPVFYIKIVYDSWECITEAKPSDTMVASPSDFPNHVSQARVSILYLGSSLWHGPIGQSSYQKFILVFWIHS